MSELEMLNFAHVT